MYGLTSLAILATTIAVFKSNLININILNLTVSHSGFKPKDNKRSPFSYSSVDFLGLSQAGFFPGEGNQHTIETGTLSVSSYINDASKHFLDSLPGNINVSTKQMEDMLLNRNENINYILFGGPVANVLTRALCGYRETYINVRAKDGSEKTKILPVFDPDSGFPFAFFCGLTGYGQFPKNLELPIDIMNSGNLQHERAIRGNDFKEKTVNDLYGIVYNNGRIIKLNKSGDELAEDMFFVIRRPNPWVVGRDITIFSGVHGYSIRAFSEKFEEYLTILNDKIQDRHFMAMFKAKFTDSSLSRVEIVTNKMKIMPLRLDRIHQWDAKMKREGRL